MHPQSRPFAQSASIGLRRAALAALSVIALALGTFTAHADPAPLFTKWYGHGRSMQLSPNGTGTFTEASGASNSETWAVSWKGDPSRKVNITLTSLTSRSGAPLNNLGDQYLAQLQNKGGQTVLNMQRADNPSSAFLFCTLQGQSGPNSPCGA